MAERRYYKSELLRRRLTPSDCIIFFFKGSMVVGIQKGTSDFNGVVYPKDYDTFYVHKVDDVGLAYHHYLQYLYG